HRRHGGLSLADARAARRPEDEAQTEAAARSARGGPRLSGPRRREEPSRAAQDGGVSRDADAPRSGEHSPLIARRQSVQSKNNSRKAGLRAAEASRPAGPRESAAAWRG